MKGTYAHKEELLPCPFCGAAPGKKGPELCLSTAVNEYWVFCNGCDASSTMIGRKEEVIAAWNRREGK